MSDANKAVEMGIDFATYKQQKITDLENNINRRDVRAGSFRVLFNAKGVPEPVSLNKTHAFVILSSPPTGLEEEYPHVLANVLVSQKVTITPIRPDIIKKLGLEEQYTELNLVETIWNHFRDMMAILQREPEPRLKQNCCEGSLKESDYYWGYTEEEINSYIQHADSFYQLYTWRYTHRALTPYMMKLVDNAPYFMKNSPFPLSRFQAEGGEHANYEHGRFYFEHTTRHGGRCKPDPILSQLRSIFKRITYSVGQDGTAEGLEAKQHFNKYCEKHHAAMRIQRCWRRYFASKQKILKKSVKNIHGECKAENKLFNGFNFVLCGNIPKIGPKKMNQAAFKTYLMDYGARIRSKIPGKGQSTKAYVILASKAAFNHVKVPNIMRQAISAGHKILDFSFVTACIEDSRR